MNFGQAIEYAKAGLKIARKGWNGKGMYVWLERGKRAELYHDREHLSGVSGDLFDNVGKGHSTVMPRFNMLSADGFIVPGWLASQTDMLADDWEVKTDPASE